MPNDHNRQTGAQPTFRIDDGNARLLSRGFVCRERFRTSPRPHLPWSGSTRWSSDRERFACALRSRSPTAAVVTGRVFGLKLLDETDGGPSRSNLIISTYETRLHSRLFEHPWASLFDEATSVGPGGSTLVSCMNYFGLSDIFIPVICQMNIQNQIDRKLAVTMT